MSGTSAPDMPPDPLPPVPTLKIGSNGKVTPNRLIRPPVKRIRLVAGSCTTRAATIFQLGFLGQPAGVVTGQGE